MGVQPSGHSYSQSLTDKYNVGRSRDTQLFKILWYDKGVAILTNRARAKDCELQIKKQSEYPIESFFSTNKEEVSGVLFDFEYDEPESIKALSYENAEIIEVNLAVEDQDYKKLEVRKFYVLKPDYGTEILYTSRSKAQMGFDDLKTFRRMCSSYVADYNN